MGNADHTSPSVQQGASTEGSSEGSASISELQDPRGLANVAAPESSRGARQPSAGCGERGSLASGAQALEVDGAKRTYLLDLPADYDGTRPYPLVFAFHGATTSAALFRTLGCQRGDVLRAIAPVSGGARSRVAARVRSRCGWRTRRTTRPWRFRMGSSRAIAGSKPAAASTRRHRVSQRHASNTLAAPTGDPPLVRVRGRTRLAGVRSARHLELFRRALTAALP